MQSFSPVRKIDRSGKLVIDEDGEPEMEPRHINVKELLECGSMEDTMALLGIRFILSLFFAWVFRLTLYYVFLFIIQLFNLLFVYLCRINGHSSRQDPKACPEQS